MTIAIIGTTSFKRINQEENLNKNVQMKMKIVQIESCFMKLK